MKIRFNSQSFGKDIVGGVRQQKRGVNPRTGAISFAFLVSVVDTAGVDPALFTFGNTLPSGQVVPDDKLRRGFEIWFSAEETPKINAKFDKVKASNGVLFFEFTPASGGNGVRVADIVQGIADPSLYYQTITLNADRYAPRIFSEGEAPAIQGLD
jgi:hypothetical protein